MEDKSEINSKAKYWQAHIETCRASGESPASYVRRNKLHIKSYYRWHSKLTREGILSKAQSKALSFNKVSLKDEIRTSEPKIKIYFPNGIILGLEGFVEDQKILSILSHWM
ncbi:MAG: hypothetical protein ACD_79C00627G0002 [uncultured bacterium]|nr:MAG: hypothetical protein ACD_79C00627G0002 [uncultured bacterium]